MPYQAAMILTRALENWGGGGGVEGVNSLLLSTVCDPVCLVLCVVLVT